MSRAPIVAGNWKMNGSQESNRRLLDGILDGLSKVAPDTGIIVCPPAVYLESVRAQIAGSRIELGAQNLCEQAKPGAYTGELHGAMLRDCGCSHVIVGHSERRALYGEDDARVAAKVAVALELGLTPIVCVGELLEERESGQTESVLARQLDAVLDRVGMAAFAGSVVAYEPVWAIGTGRTASPEQAQEAHAFIRGRIAARDATIAGSTRLLYGGSVKPDNAAALFAGEDVDGGLIGGASLSADDFLAIADAARS